MSPHPIYQTKQNKTPSKPLKTVLQGLSFVLSAFWDFLEGKKLYSKEL
jgi:hypothetical protein